MDYSMNLAMCSEAKEILSIFRLYGLDSNLYKSDNVEKIDALFDAVVYAIDDTKELKVQLPYNEFVKPSRCVIEGDDGWVGHFEERDNRRFFLSDVHDYLHLFFK